ncbi:MAG: DUF222 domain-containing protein, partial [Acidimicrobiales bacterium]
MSCAGTWTTTTTTKSPAGAPTSTSLSPSTRSKKGQGGELADGTLVDAKTMARLACDADVHRVIMDRSSTVLDYGRRARVVPDGLRNALNVRDRHYRFPDCDRPPAWCEAHHIFDWELGGHTKPDKLVLLCSRHPTTTSSTSTAGNTASTPTTPSKY